MEAIVNLIIGFILGGLSVWLIMRSKLRANDEVAKIYLLEQYEQQLRESSGQSEDFTSSRDDENGHEE